MEQFGEAFRVCAGLGSCEAAVQTEDWLNGLLEDKKRCEMIINERCAMCENGAEECVKHLLVTCGEFERD